MTHPSFQKINEVLCPPLLQGGQTPTICKIGFLLHVFLSTSDCLCNTHALQIAHRALSFPVSDSLCPEQAQDFSTLHGPALSPHFQPLGGHVHFLPHSTSDSVYPTQPIIFPPKLVPCPVSVPPASPVAPIRSLRINFESCTSAVPNLFGTRDQFLGEDFSTDWGGRGGSGNGSGSNVSDGE